MYTEVSNLPKNEQACRFRNDGEVRTLMWEVSRFCNLACLHCCTYSSPNASISNDFSTENMISIVQEFDKLSIESVFFSGGEPLLRKGFFDVLDEIKKTKTRVFIASNGTIINQKMAKRLKTAGVFAIDISLDGYTSELHNSVRLHKSAFDKAIEGIKACVEEDIPLRVSGMITPLNVNCIANFVELLVSLKIRKVVFSSIVGAAGRAQENPQLILDRELIPFAVNQIHHAQKKFGDKIQIDHRLSEETQKIPGCAAGQKFLYISSEGDVSGCSWLYKLDPDRFSLGNVKQDSLSSCISRNQSIMEPLLEKTQWCPIPHIR